MSIVTNHFEKQKFYRRKYSMDIPGTQLNVASYTVYIQM